MRLKLDENVPRLLVVILSKAGHDVEHVYDEGLTGRPDPDVWSAAQREERFLITQDVRFADIRVFAGGRHAGLMLVRLKRPGIRSLTARISAAFAHEQTAEWPGAFIVLTDSRIRIRKPKPQG